LIVFSRNILKKIYHVQGMHNAVENGATKAKHTRKFKSCLLTRKNPLKHKLTLD